MKQKMTKVLDQVKILLTNHSHLRDDDEKLMATMWFKHMGKKLEEMSAFDLLKQLSVSNLPSYESISRCRRKLQEECPELRGEKWEKRHKSQENVKEDLDNVKKALQSTVNNSNFNPETGEVTYQAIGDETI